MERREPLHQPTRIRRPWLREGLVVLVFYYVYRTVQRLAKVGGVEPRAFANARRIVSAERFLGFFVEQPLQSAFLHFHWLIKGMNIFYGTFHFVVTPFVLAFLFVKRPWLYLKMRNLLGATTGLALIGYYAFPLAPPRLLVCNDSIPAPGPTRAPILGKCFVDTLDRFGGLWSFESPTVKAVANEFAAMPSLHFAWSLWCAIVVVRHVDNTWARAAAVLYPAVTLFAIVVTANHYFLDAVGGALTLYAGARLMGAIARRRQRRTASNSAA